MLKNADKIREGLCELLDEYGKAKITPSSANSIQTITDAIKNLDKIEMLESGYSEGMWSAEGSYEGGSSYRHRDSMGRYARDGYRGYSDRGYSDRGYSRGGDMVEHLEKMMREASSEKEREAIRCAIEKIER